MTLLLLLLEENEDDDTDEDEIPEDETLCLEGFLSTTAGCLFFKGHVEVLGGGVSFQPGCETGGFGEADRRLRLSCSACMRDHSVEMDESLRVPPYRRPAVLIVTLLVELLLLLILIVLPPILGPNCCCCCCNCCCCNCCC